MVQIALACLSIAFAQTAQVPALSPAKAVDIRVESTDWHPGGQELLYTRAEENGIGVGLYKLGAPQGKVLLHLGKHDDYSHEWFAGTNACLVTVYRTAEGKKQGTVYLLDGDKETAVAIFGRTVDAKKELSIDAQLSPSLTHAIFDVTEDTKHYHSALTLNSKEAVAAPDIDQAIVEGFGGPAWSVDGTAIYAKGLPNGNTINLTLQDGQATTRQQVEGTVVFALKADGGSQVAGKLDSILSNFFVLRGTPAKAPEAGTPVLELMPSNATMRQVRSPGPWIEAATAPPTVETKDHAVAITFGTANGSANSVWLTRAAKEKAPVNTDGGVLIAPHADSAELSPGERAVAYIIDGALFVRALGRH